MTECNGCGRCCHPVSLPFSQFAVQTNAKGTENMNPRTRRWVLEELVPISRREGLEMRRDLRGSGSLTWVRDHFEAGYSFFFLCRNFDPDTRLCAAYDDRPDVCSGYPHYGQRPRADAIPKLPPECSFRADYGQPVMPAADWQPIPLVPRLTREQRR